MSLLASLGINTQSSPLSSLADLSAEIQSFVVAPLAAFGVGGFVFNAQGDAIANLSADITDHYTEDNRALQDHIAIKPKKITLKGYVGELIHGESNGIVAAVSTLTPKLGVISAFLPNLANGFTNVASSSSNVTLTSASNLYGLTQNILAAFGNTKNQQNAYNYFRSLMESATLMGVQTPWEFMPNMAIESIQAVQDEKSIYITDFSITLKQIRIATAQNSPFSTSGLQAGITAGIQSLQGATALQVPTTINQGNSPGQPLPAASLPGAQGTIASASDLANIPVIKAIYNAVFK